MANYTAGNFTLCTEIYKMYSYDFYLNNVHDFKSSLFYGTYKSSSYVCLCISIFRYFMTIKYTIFLWIRKWVVCDVVIGCSFFFVRQNKIKKESDTVNVYILKWLFIVFSIYVVELHIFIFNLFQLPSYVVRLVVSS